MTHRTANDTDEFRYSIAFDFVSQVDDRMHEIGMSHRTLAKTVGVSEGRISQVMNNPGNLTMATLVKMARAVRLKVAVVAYDDGDTEGTSGPIFAQVFERCWSLAGKPDGFDGNGNPRKC